MFELEGKLEFAKAYRDLGWSVQNQLDSIVENPDLKYLEEQGELNANAVKMIRGFLENYGGEDAESILEDIDEWFKEGEFDELGFR